MKELSNNSQNHIQTHTLIEYYQSKIINSGGESYNEVK